ncbi:MAG: prepilin-type N-terminal cleavage/methylation domain-containing protein [bacterium]|nr:prepilin-type N-terminal cleavage/methylation domain-containing protein [bacterium]
MFYLYSYRNSRKLKNLQTGKENGFSLVEMIVSLAVFAIAAVVAGGAFISVLGSNKKAQSAKNAINNMNYALESMSREIRTGKNFFCTYEDELSNAVSTYVTTDMIDSCPSGNFLVFNSRKIDSGGNVIYYAYFYDDRVTEKDIKKAEKIESDLPFGTADFSSIMSPNSKVNNFNFRVEDAGSNLQTVKIFIDGEAGDKDKLKTFFNAQTTVTQRL